MKKACATKNYFQEECAVHLYYSPNPGRYLCTNQCKQGYNAFIAAQSGPKTYYQCTGL